MSFKRFCNELTKSFEVNGDIKRLMKPLQLYNGKGWMNYVRYEKKEIYEGVYKYVFEDVSTDKLEYSIIKWNPKSHTTMHWHRDKNTLFKVMQCESEMINHVVYDFKIDEYNMIKKGSIVCSANWPCNVTHRIVNKKGFSYTFHIIHNMDKRSSGNIKMEYINTDYSEYYSL